MSKGWYPVIDYEKCTKCLVCYNWCKNGAYTLDEKEQKPIVSSPDNCIHGCRGCGTKCPVGAIQYFGDTENK